MHILLLCYLNFLYCLLYLNKGDKEPIYISVLGKDIHTTAIFWRFVKLQPRKLDVFNWDLT